MNYKLVATPPFERELKQLSKSMRLFQEDILGLEHQLLKNPTLGIATGRNCFKIRLAIRLKGRGKSGGGRIITYVQVIDKKIFLIAIYDKSDFENISEKELQSWLKQL